MIGIAGNRALQNCKSLPRIPRQRLRYREMRGAVRAFRIESGCAFQNLGGLTGVPVPQQHLSQHQK